jgi:hypothetical protein
MIRRLASDSISARAVATIALLLAGYLLLYQRFAAFDAALARHALDLLGFRVSSPRPGDLSVHAGRSFNLYAVVTGSCSSAAGVLGLASVSIVLLPGRPWRRLVGGLAAATLFIVFNVARICSIVLVGWWLATTSRDTVFTTLATLAVVGLVVALIARGRLFLRIGALLAGGLCAVLAYDVQRGYDYLDGMASYHALAGPILTFGTLALGILIIWRVLVGAEQPAQRHVSSS